jgi:hypothetical protein
MSTHEGSTPNNAEEGPAPHSEHKGSLLHSEPEEEEFELPQPGKKAPKVAPKKAPNCDPVTIKLIWMKDYTNISKIAERNHLNNNNWHEWKEHITCIFINCNIVGYI